MIIKVKTSSGWFLETDVSNAVYVTERDTPKWVVTDAIRMEESAEALKRSVSNKDTQTIVLKSSNDYPKSFSEICFTDSKGKRCSLWFDSIAYLCNDLGKTIDTFRVPLKYNKSSGFSKKQEQQGVKRKLCESGTGRTTEVFRQALKLSELKAFEVLIMCKHLIPGWTDAFYEAAKQFGYAPERLSPSTVKVGDTQYRMLGVPNSDFFDYAKDTVVFYDHSVYEK